MTRTQDELTNIALFGYVNLAVCPACKAEQGDKWWKNKGYLGRAGNYLRQKRRELEQKNSGGTNVTPDGV